jgi:hypothetical protein
VIGLGPNAPELRRRLGPLTWAVLEHVASDADPTGWSEATARRVAEDLGIGKDAAAGALGRLVEAGLLVRGGQQRTSGRFGSGGYQLALPSSVLIPCPVATDTAQPDVEPPARRRKPLGASVVAEGGGQLSFALPGDAEPSTRSTKPAFPVKAHGPTTSTQPRPSQNPSPSPQTFNQKLAAKSQTRLHQGCGDVLAAPGDDVQGRLC